MSAGSAALPPEEPPEGHDSPRRTRREHKKSRLGCQTCKKRHVRCDERLPICTNCLTRGDPCLYDRPPQGPGSASQGVAGGEPLVPLAMAAPRRGSSPLAALLAGQGDPFRSQEIEMPGKSFELQHHFMSWRNELRSLVFSSPVLEPEGIFPGKYSANAAYHRGLLLMSAKHHYGLTGRCEWASEPTFLHHKTEVIRLLKDQIDKNPASPADWSFTVIFFLIAMESLDDNQAAAETHIKGLITLLKTIKPQDRALYLAGQTLVRLGLLFCSLVEASRKSHQNFTFNPPRWRFSHDPLAPTHAYDWANVAYTFSIMISEFLVKDSRLIAVQPAEAKDVACLRWVVGAMRAMRQNAAEALAAAGQAGHRGLYDAQKKIWVIAGLCYALLLISLAGPVAAAEAAAAAEGAIEEGEASGSSSMAAAAAAAALVVAGEGDDLEAKQGLAQLYAWWEEKIEKWLEEPALPSYDLAMEVLDKVVDLTTPEGERVIEQLYRECMARMAR